MDEFYELKKTIKKKKEHSMISTKISKISNDFTHRNPTKQEFCIKRVNYVGIFSK